MAIHEYENAYIAAIVLISLVLCMLCFVCVAWAIPDNPRDMKLKWGSLDEKIAFDVEIRPNSMIETRCGGQCAKVLAWMYFTIITFLLIINNMSFPVSSVLSLHFDAVVAPGDGEHFEVEGWNTTVELRRPWSELPAELEPWRSTSEVVLWRTDHTAKYYFSWVVVVAFTVPMLTAFLLSCGHKFFIERTSDKDLETLACCCCPCLCALMLAAVPIALANVVGVAVIVGASFLGLEATFLSAVLMPLRCNRVDGSTYAMDGIADTPCYGSPALVVLSWLAAFSIPGVIFMIVLRELLLPELRRSFHRPTDGKSVADRAASLVREVSSTVTLSIKTEGGGADDQEEDKSNPLLESPTDWPERDGPREVDEQGKEHEDTATFAFSLFNFSTTFFLACSHSIRPFGDSPGADIATGALGFLVPFIGFLYFFFFFPTHYNRIKHIATVTAYAFVGMANLLFFCFFLNSVTELKARSFIWVFWGTALLFTVCSAFAMVRACRYAKAAKQQHSIQLVERN